MNPTQTLTQALSTNPIRIIDCDLWPAGNHIDTIHVWYQLEGCELTQGDLCGHDFFLKWLPAETRQQHKTIGTYWRRTHPYERNDQIGKYLLDRAPLVGN